SSLRPVLEWRHADGAEVEPVHVDEAALPLLDDDGLAGERLEVAVGVGPPADASASAGYLDGVDLRSHPAATSGAGTRPSASSTASARVGSRATQHVTCMRA